MYGKAVTRTYVGRTIAIMPRLPRICQGTNPIPDVSGCKYKNDNGWLASQRYNSMSPQLAWLDILLRSGGRPRKLTEIVLELVDAATMENDETTAKELYIILQQRGVVISL